MSGTKHSDTHVEYILDTPTWLGPYEGHALRARAGDRAAPGRRRARGGGAAGPAAGSVVEAHLQCDRQRRLRADRPAARRPLRGRGGAVGSRPPRARPGRRGEARRRGGGSRAARRSLGDERAGDAARQRALSVDARGRRGASADRGGADQRRARARGGARYGVEVPLHTAVYRLVAAREASYS